MNQKPYHGQAGPEPDQHRIRQGQREMQGKTQPSPMSVPRPTLLPQVLYPDRYVTAYVGSQVDGQNGPIRTTATMTGQVQSNVIVQSCVFAWFDSGIQWRHWSGLDGIALGQFRGLSQGIVRCSAVYGPASGIDTALLRTGWPKRQSDPGYVVTDPYVLDAAGAAFECSWQGQLWPMTPLAMTMESGGDGLGDIGFRASAPSTQMHGTPSEYWPFYGYKFYIPAFWGDVAQCDSVDSVELVVRPTWEAPS